MTRDPLIIPTTDLSRIDPIMVPLVLLGAAVKAIVDHQLKATTLYLHLDGSIHDEPEPNNPQMASDITLALEYKRLGIKKSAQIITIKPNCSGYTAPQPIPGTVKRFM